MKKATIVLLGLLFTSVMLAAAVHLSTEKCVFTIKGTSNVHDWESSSTKGQVTGTLDIEGAVIKDVSSINITIPVKSIVSEKGSVMDNKTWKALKASKHPNITFKMTSLKGMTKATLGYDLSVDGKLSIAGVTKTVNLQVHGVVLKGNKVKFTGSKKVKMTDYGVEPPVAFFGAMTTGDEVTLEYDIILKP